MFAEAFLRQARQQQPSNPKVLPGTLPFRDQCVRRLLNPVMEECMRLLRRTSPLRTASRSEVWISSSDWPRTTSSRDLGDVPETGELFKTSCVVADNRRSFPTMNPRRCRSSPWRGSGPRPSAQPALPGRTEATLPRPMPRGTGSRRTDCRRSSREPVAPGAGAFRVTMEGIGDKPADIVEPKRRQHDFLHPRSALRIASSVRISG